DVAQPRHAAIDEVFALSGTVQPPADRHFSRLGCQCWFLFTLLLSLKQLLESAPVFLCFSGLRVVLAQLFLSLAGFWCIGCCRAASFYPSLLCALCALCVGCFVFRSAFHHEPRRFRQLRIFHRDGHFRHAQRRALGRSIEDTIRHALGTQRLVALLQIG